MATDRRGRRGLVCVIAALAVAALAGGAVAMPLRQLASASSFVEMYVNEGLAQRAQGPCQKQGTCCFGNFCPFSEGVCCPDLQTCCPRGLDCLPARDGQPQRCGHKEDLEDQSPYISPDGNINPCRCKKPPCNCQYTVVGEADEFHRKVASPVPETALSWRAAEPIKDTTILVIPKNRKLIYPAGGVPAPAVVPAAVPVAVAPTPQITASAPAASLSAVSVPAGRDGNKIAIVNSTLSPSIIAVPVPEAAYLNPNEERDKKRIQHLMTSEQRLKKAQDARRQQRDEDAKLRQQAFQTEDQVKKEIYEMTVTPVPVPQAVMPPSKVENGAPLPQKSVSAVNNEDLNDETAKLMAAVQQEQADRIQAAFDKAAKAETFAAEHVDRAKHANDVQTHVHVHTDTAKIDASDVRLDAAAEELRDLQDELSRYRKFRDST